VFPLRRPSKFVAGARTVLAVKGSLRRAERALACCAPFWPEDHAMGGSGGNTPPPLPQQKRKARFLLAEKAGLAFKKSNRQHLEKVLTGRSISEQSRDTRGSVFRRRSLRQIKQTSISLSFNNIAFSIAAR